MFRISDFIDLPIKALKEESPLKCTVKSVLIDGFNNKIAALVCKEGAIKKYSQIIPYTKIISVDINGIVVPDQGSLRKIPSKELSDYIQIEEIINKSVKTNLGDLQGILTDIYVEVLTGRILSYELSEGYYDDIVSGRKIIQLEGALKENANSQVITLYQRLN